MPRRLPRVLLGTLVLAGATLAACADEAEQSPIQIVTGAAEQTAEVAGMDTSVRADLSGAGAEDGTIMSLEGTQAADGTSMVGHMEIAGQRVRTIYVDGSYFYGFPDLPDGKEWAEVTEDDLLDIGYDAAAAQGQDSSQTLAFLEAAGEVEEIGDEEIDGDAVTLYEAQVRVDDLNTEIVSGELREQMEGMLGEELVMEVAIDDDGYVRRMEYAVDLSESPDPPPGTPERGVITYTFEMSEFTDDYEVPTAPDPDTVISMAELNGG